METKKLKKVFVEGAIPPEKIAQSVANHQSKTNIGAHSIFLGQIRADKIDGKTVAAIQYTAYEEMAGKVFHEIREAAFAKFDITCAHIYHSLGTVKAGELCLFVFTSSAHRKTAIEATNYFVEEIKAKVPIFGKEIFEDETHQWKVNK
ncbi:molybdenum cofactor biosynthesis protein MoaE [Flagellimonas sediminis]|uniref:Molybdopterin synthase catalytic subunit n=1 Tax=Flagellimonas sediminis TaxID=2696468 RepID=A0A6I5L4Z4_9FLAO|nr:molybdenum cofactor biosynthesis protein MoaE [Allomuricauda sediminis]NDV44761.1 molybdenum cofactor biosynthesis protein MoaE [Allomuricauda sediminis]